MHILSTHDRDASMTNLVSYHEVPMPRGIAFAIRDIENQGAPVSVFSADRTHAAIAAHNAQFHTHLSSQEELVALFHAGKGNPANSPETTSHCYYADFLISGLLAQHGTHVPAGGRMPWWALGIDLSDKGKVEDVSHFLAIAAHLGYKFVQPYASGAERHHVILVETPIPVLEHRNQIAKVRHA